MLTLIVFIILVALLFDFLNGMNDAANSIATIVSTSVLSPRLKVAAFIVLSPVLALGASLMLAVNWLFRHANPWRADRLFRVGQLLSSAAFSLGHGTNDAQKTMGIIAVLLYTGGYLGPVFCYLLLVSLAGS
jgi:phosphate/sulfate permease